MIYKKYVNFLRSIETNRRKSLAHLLKIVQNTCMSVTGANLRKILLNSGVYVIPGQTTGFELNNYKVYIRDSTAAVSLKAT